MKQLKVSTREIGAVGIFDLDGHTTEATVQDAAHKIERMIRRRRMQRVILNLKHTDGLDPIGVRRLMAACLRPHDSLIYGASQELAGILADTHVPQNVTLCQKEEEVAEYLGPYLMEKSREKKIVRESSSIREESVGHALERRRAKRMHVAIPVELMIRDAGGREVRARAITTNISEGGLFAEFLDLDEAEKVWPLTERADYKTEMTLLPCANFPEKYCVTGQVIRWEMKKKQIGLAVKFDETH
ncbi:MAG: PilZ domain-containing protein [Candidatus Omnitrophota bacterium]